MEGQRQSASTNILGHILGMLERGELRPGDKLPTERAFAQQLGVSRVPLREAVSALSVLGILEPRQGAGTYVGSYNPEVMGRVFYAYAVLEGTPLSEMAVTRKALESQVAWQAAIEATEEEKAAIQEAVDAYAELAKKPDTENFCDELVAADLAFHTAVATASHNGFMAKILGTVRATFDTLYAKSRTQDPKEAAKLAAEVDEAHKAIAAAIAAGDPQDAWSAAYAHLQWIEEQVEG